MITYWQLAFRLIVAFFFGTLVGEVSKEGGAFIGLILLIIAVVFALCKAYL